MSRAYMSTRSNSLRCLAAALTLLAAHGTHAASAVSGGGTSRELEIQDLPAGRPADGLARQLELFGQFVGDWDLRSETYVAGRTERNVGRMHMRWILYGTALQDVWTSDAPEQRPGLPRKSFGTTLRYFDENAKVWRIVWVAPIEGGVQTFVAREVKGQIVLDAQTSTGEKERWIWANYTADSFDWRSEESSDGGSTWKVTQRIWGKRQLARSR